MLKYGEVNPLTVFGLRRIEHCPPHFTPVDFSLKTSEKAVSDWVWTNLSGRFFYGDYYFKDEKGAVQMCKRVAFEQPGEASMFALLLDTINAPKYM